MPFEIDGTRYFSLSEVAVEVGVSRQTLYRWIDENKVHGPRYERQRDGRRFYTEAELRAINSFAHNIEPVDASPDQMRLFNGSGTGGVV